MRRENEPVLALCCVLTFLEKEQCTAEQAGLKTLMTALSSSLFAMVLRMLLRAGNLTGDLGRAVVAAEAERMREQMEDIIERPRQKALLGRPELQRMQSFGRKKVSFMRRAASRRIPSARGGGLSGWWDRVRMRMGRGSLPRSSSASRSIFARCEGSRARNPFWSRFCLRESISRNFFWTSVMFLNESMP